MTFLSTPLASDTVTSLELTQARLSYSSSSARLWGRAGSISKSRKLPRTRYVACSCSSPPYHEPLAHSSAQISWTRFEIEATKDHVSTFAQDDATAPSAPPPLTILSLSARTVVHLNENKREMVCASARVWTDGELSRDAGLWDIL